MSIAISRAEIINQYPSIAGRVEGRARVAQGWDMFHPGKREERNAGAERALWIIGIGHDHLKREEFPAAQVQALPRGGINDGWHNMIGQRVCAP